MKKYLFHGSQCGTITVLEPRISVGFNKPLVYATDDYRYALVRAGKQEDLIREEYYGFGKPFELAEIFKNSFIDQFECKGYIYLLDPNDFEDRGFEFVSSKPVIPVDRIEIPNIWSYMRRLNVDGDYDLHWYDDEEYWSTVRGGRKGFLYRKQIRKILLEEAD